MGKSRRKPYTPPTQWDMGPSTSAARNLTVVEERGDIDPKTGKRHNPNGVKGRRRVCWVELYGAKGSLSARQVKAGLALSAAFEQTQRSAPAVKKVQVDTFPKPDAHVDIMVNRMDAYHRIARHVPQKFRPFIDHVVLKNRPIRSMAGCSGGRSQQRYLERLADGLEILADRLDL